MNTYSHPMQESKRNGGRGRRRKQGAIATLGLELKEHLLKIWPLGKPRTKRRCYAHLDPIGWRTTSRPRWSWKNSDFYCTDKEAEEPRLSDFFFPKSRWGPKGNVLLVVGSPGTHAASLRSLGQYNQKAQRWIWGHQGHFPDYVQDPDSHHWGDEWTEWQDQNDNV